MNTATQITLSKTTLAILKNFSSLNSNILVYPGNVIKTITPSMNGMAEATVEETFDTQFGIWDLNKFLGVISLYSNPTFDFQEKFVTIHGNNNSVINQFSFKYKLGAVITPAQNPIQRQHLYSFSKQGNHDDVLLLNDSNIEPYLRIKHIPIEANI